MSSSNEINSNDFNFLNESFLQKKPKQGRPKKNDDSKLQKKLQITVTGKEYKNLEEQFKKSGFPNFGSFVRKEAIRLGLIKTEEIN
jgi:hypothetical protein